MTIPVKIACVILIVLTMIALSVAKVYCKELDVSSIQTLLFSLLTALGVYHMNQPPKD